MYEFNGYLFDEYAKGKKLKGMEKERYLLYRPDDKAVDEFVEFVENFWNVFCEKVPVVREYILAGREQIESQNLRSGEGGNLLFRPIALSQKGASLEEAFQNLARIPMVIQEKPWKNVLWLEERKIVNGRVRKKDLMLMMLSMVDETLLQQKEKDALIKYLVMSLRKWRGDVEEGREERKVGKGVMSLRKWMRMSKKEEKKERREKEWQPKQ